MSRTPAVDRPAPPTAAVRASQTMSRWLEALQRKLAPPQIVLLDLVMSRWRVDALVALTRLGVPDALARGPRTAGEVARELGLHEDSLFRVLRALASDGLLEAHPDRRFALTPITRALVSDAPNSMRWMVMNIGLERSARTWSRLDHSIRTGQPAWSLFHEGDLWAHLANDLEEARIFHGAMVELTREGASAYARAFEFDGFGSVVDIGGGEGQLLASILRAHPGLRGVLVDAASALAGAPAVLDAHGVRDRCEVIEADIEEEIPAGHGVYVAKNIVHGLPQGEEVKVLRTFRAAMSPTSRLVLIEVVVPEDGGPYLQFLDLQMLVGSGGRERTRAEYADLLSRAGLRLERVIDTPTPMSMIVAAPT